MFLTSPFIDHTNTFLRVISGKIAECADCLLQTSALWWLENVRLASGIGDSRHISARLILRALEVE